MVVVEGKVEGDLYRLYGEQVLLHVLREADNLRDADKHHGTD